MSNHGSNHQHYQWETMVAINDSQAQTLGFAWGPENRAQYEFLTGP